MVEFGDLLKKWSIVLKTSKWFYQTCIYLSSSLIFWGCAKPSSLVSPTEQSNLVVSETSKPIPKKPVNSLGGYFYSNGKGRCPDGSRLNRILGYCVEGNQALGPFSQK